MSGQDVLTHINADGDSRMVNVSDKPPTVRRARAQARVRMQPATWQRVVAGDVPKGDVLAAVRIAGIQAAKQTGTLIPLCHPLMLEAVTVDVTSTPPDTVIIVTDCRVTAKTGVEMEALTAATVAALTLYDMLKAIDRGITIEQVRLLTKSGGASGDYVVDAAD